MADSPEFVLMDGEEMEDFHDYEDEEQGEIGSKLDEYEDIEEDDDDEVEPAPVVVETIIAVVEAVPVDPEPVVVHDAPPKKPVKKATAPKKAAPAKKAA